MPCHGGRCIESDFEVALTLPDRRSLQWWTDLDRTGASFARFSERYAASLRRWHDAFGPIVEGNLIPEATAPARPSELRRGCRGPCSDHRAAFTASPAPSIAPWTPGRPIEAPCMSVSGEICYRLARYLVRRRHLGAAGANPNSFTRGSYQDWRRRELERQYTTNFALDLIRGKDVVDFGCGGGELSLFVLRHGARTVTGVEISEAQYELALSNCKERGYLDRIQFVLSQHSDVVPLPSESADVILCFDVLEHVLEYDRVITEWLRILRSNGILLIWWAPYHHPYGHHVESLVPIPWIHVILSDDAILESCARIYDSEEFTPRIWDLDEQGNKKPNKWKDIKKLPDVNKLSIREFESIARNVGFSFDRQEYRPISSSVVAKKIASALQRFPSSRELTTSCVTYQLRKP